MKKIYIAALVGLAASLAACDDAINRLPKDQESADDYFKTAEQLELFTNPLYNNLLPEADDVAKEISDVQLNAALSAWVRSGSSRTVPATGGGWTWTNLRRMNDLLERSHNCNDEKAVLMYNAVARFFRAYFYFEKIERFGDVPWIDRPLGSDEDALYNARDSREYVMTKMLEDIEYAFENLPVKEDYKAGERSFRATKGAALALKCRFCTFEGTFRKYHNINLEGHDYKFYLEQAVDAAEKLMSGQYGKYELYNTGKPTEDYQWLFVQEDAPEGEVILGRSYREVIQDNTHGLSLYAILPTHGRPGFTRKFINTYLMKDGSRFTDKIGWQTMQFNDEVKDRDPRLAQTIRVPGYHFYDETRVRGPQFDVSCTGYHPVKFVQSPLANNKLAHTSQGKCTNDIYAMRLAEVYLNYAECKAELGTLTQTDLNNSVNLIRRRAGMPDMSVTEANGNPDPYLSAVATGYPNVEGPNKGIILEIRRERTIELAMEALRVRDLIRWKCGKCIEQEFYGMYFPGPGNYDLTGDGKTDVCLFANGTAKPKLDKTTINDDIQYYELGKELFLSDGTRGYVDYHGGNKIERNGFNEARDYLYPIPTTELSLNINLVQNPGW